MKVQLSVSIASKAWKPASATYAAPAGPVHVDEARWVALAPAGEPWPVTVITVAVPAASITAAAPATSAWRLARPERTSKEGRSDIQITPAVLTAASRTGLEPDGWTGNVWF